MNRDYEMYLKHARNIKAWNKRVDMGTIADLHLHGAITPMCFVIFYDFDMDEYTELVIDVDTDALRSPDSRRRTIKTLRDVTLNSNMILLALKFVAEGTIETVDTRELLNFLLLTYETPVQGRKRVYFITKTAKVLQNGTTALNVDNIYCDRPLSRGRKMMLFEEFSHILRPNWANKLIGNYN